MTSSEQGTMRKRNDVSDTQSDLRKRPHDGVITDGWTDGRAGAQTDRRTDGRAGGRRPYIHFPNDTIFKN